MPCVPGLVCSLIPFPALITREELAEIGKRLLSIARGVVLLLRGDYRALPGLLALLRAFPSLTRPRRAFPFLLRTLPSLAPTYRALLSLILTRKTPLTVL